MTSTQTSLWSVRDTVTLDGQHTDTTAGLPETLDRQHTDSTPWAARDTGWEAHTQCYTDGTAHTHH